MLKEMDEAGVRWGVVPGRLSPVLGTIAPDDVAAIVADHPDRLIGYAADRSVGPEKGDRGDRHGD